MSVDDGHRAFRDTEVIGQRRNDGVIGASVFGRFADSYRERPILGSLDARFLCSWCHSNREPHAARVPEESIVAKPVTIEDLHVAIAKAVADQRHARSATAGGGASGCWWNAEVMAIYIPEQAAVHCIAWLDGLGNHRKRFQERVVKTLGSNAKITTQPISLAEMCGGFDKPKPWAIPTISTAPASASSTDKTTAGNRSRIKVPTPTNVATGPARIYRHTWTGPRPYDTSGSNVLNKPNITKRPPYNNKRTNELQRSHPTRVALFI